MTKDPLYLSVYKKIKSDLINNKYKKGDKIPKELELCETYNVSRLTVRRALDELVREGLLKRVKGTGTFFNGFKTEEVLTRLSSFTDESIKNGFSSKSIVLENTLITIPEELIPVFNLPINSKILKLKRIRYRNEEPYAIETAYLNLAADIRLLNILDEDMNKKSLYSILINEYKLSLKYAEETIEVTQLSLEESKYLEQKKNSPAALRRQITKLDNGICIEYVVAVYRADKYKFKVVKNF
ncbi:GntR family transcriptional regulator [Tepiditoga spiralis]|uniref:GntR family transcriptional regulator n=1 Tax=Tepiditoga spiralis TaxID=2108365 RepID=A0A7G1G8V8_9BACT|nr:GntR family transcriptional regulator [Tepiditoga spiralis]BBE31674.1 GntR family transcriptional regulator [Tepiditoga spiralis]